MFIRVSLAAVLLTESMMTTPSDMSGPAVSNTSEGDPLWKQHSYTVSVGHGYS